MAVYVPFPNGVQVQLVFVLDGEIVSNRLWFWTAGDPPTTANLVDLADGVYTWHTANILPYLSQDIQLATVVATDWSLPGQVGEVTTFPPINGGDIGESISANVAVVVPFRWPLQYKRLKGNKNYVPGVPEASITLNSPSFAIQDALFEAYAALIDYARTISPGDYWYWVVASAILGNVPRSEMFFGESIGPPPRPFIKLGQRRRRLPLS